MHDRQDDSSSRMADPTIPNTMRAKKPTLARGADGPPEPAVTTARAGP
ncbi:hypothetical protein [Streptomyces sp. NPDC088348]